MCRGGRIRGISGVVQEKTGTDNSNTDILTSVLGGRW
jgi:hypothetical protein